MALRCICFIVLTIGAASGASKKNGGDRVAALYVKDGESGDLRFLTGGSNGNAGLNQYITQKQNLLEQLRPNRGNVNLGFGTTNTGTLGTLGTLGTVGSVGTIGSTNTNGITPIIVSLGNAGTSNANNNGIQAVGSGVSPIGDFLPQIVAQAVLNQRRIQNQNANRRRVVNNRRRSGNAQIFLIRPNA